jgi:hypothetical protein
MSIEDTIDFFDRNRIRIVHCSNKINEYIHMTYIHHEDFGIIDNINNFYSMHCTNNKPHTLSNFNKNKLSIILHNDEYIDINNNVHNEHDIDWHNLFSDEQNRYHIINLKKTDILLCYFHENKIIPIQKIKKNKIKNYTNNIYSEHDVCNINMLNLWCINKRGGLILCNSDSGINLIKQVLLLSENSSHVVDRYMCSVKPALDDLCVYFKDIENSEQKREYIQLFNHYTDIDKEYFVDRYSRFKDKLINFFLNIQSTDNNIKKNTLIEFVSGLKYQLSIELSLMYSWFQLNNSCLEEIYTKLNDNAYIQIIKSLDKYFIEVLKPKGNKLLYHHDVYKYLTNDTGMIVYTDKWILLFDAIKSRHELFEILTKHCKNKIIPMKIFYDKIFLMEQLLSYDMQHY